MASEKALVISEILSTVLSFSSLKDLVAAALTCRAWSETAFRWIWRDLDTIVPLVEIFLPLIKVPGMPVTWTYNTNYFKLERYDRLRFYGRFVRSIYHDDQIKIKGVTGSLQIKVYLSITAAAHGRQPFLPNLKSLKCIIRDASTAVGIGTLVGANVTKLDLHIHLQTHIGTIIESLRSRVPKIRSLTIAVLPQVVLESMEAPLSDLLAESTELVAVKLPQFFISKRISSALSAAKGLEQLLQADRCDYRVANNEKGRHLVFGGGGFTKLTWLEFNMGLAEAAENFLSPAAPRALDNITIATREITEPGVLRRFLEALVSSNHGLHQVCLNLYTGEIASNADVIPFDVLTPLLRLDIRNFLITHDQPLGYVAADILTMAAAWPNITELGLNEEVVVADITSPPPGLDLEHLVLFTTFPKLTVLSVYLQVSTEFQTSITYPRSRFKLLQSLSLGSSVLLDTPDSEEIASFMAALMPEEYIELDMEYTSWFPSSPVQGSSNKTWERVLNILPNFHQAQERLQLEIERKDRELQERDNMTAFLLAAHASLLEENRMLKERSLVLESELAKKNTLVDSPSSREQELQPKSRG